MMMTEMMGSFKQDLLTEFEDYFSSSVLEDGPTDTILSDHGESSTIAKAVDTYLNADTEASSSQSTSFADLAAEFSTADQTGPPIDDQLANLVSELCKEHLPKAKLDAVLGQYHRPSNCNHLVSPKVNKVVWQQLNQAVRTTDNAMQRCQKLVLASVNAMLQACTQDHTRCSALSHPCPRAGHGRESRDQPSSTGFSAPTPEFQIFSPMQPVHPYHHGAFW